MANLTDTQIETLISSSRLSKCFKRLLESRSRNARNEARKKVKENGAEEVYHEESYEAEQYAKKFHDFAKKNHRLLSDNKSIEKGMLVDAIADFDYPETLVGKSSDEDIITVISVATYNHPAKGVVNIFELIVDQAFSEDSISAKEPNPNPLPA